MAFLLYRFNLAETITMALNANIPLFDACLGLQDIVEFFDGKESKIPPLI